MDPDLFAQLFNAQTPNFSADPYGSLGAGQPQITPTMMYPFTSVGAQPPQLPPPPSLRVPAQFASMDTGQPTNEVGQALGYAPPETTGGGNVPGAEPPAPMSYSRNQATPGVETTQPQTPEQGQQQTKPASIDRLLQTLRGVQAPAPPQAQHITTPRPAATHPVQGGYKDLATLMASLGISPQQLPRLGRL